MARVVINCGVVPVQVGGMEDGVITFGKHSGQKLSDPEVHWRYLAWAYAYLESHRLPDYLMPVLELVWYWGNLKWEADDHGEDDKDFDELVDECRIRMDEAFQEEDKVREQTGWQLTYDYDAERDEWDTISVAEKRRRERERAREQADAAVAEALEGGSGEQRVG